MGTFEEIADVGMVELIDALGAPGWELETLWPDVGGPLVGTGNEALAGDVVGLNDPLEDNGMLMLVVVGPGLLEVGTVVAFTGEGSTVAVVVYVSKSVPKMVPSL